MTYLITRAALACLLVVAGCDAPSGGSQTGTAPSTSKPDATPLAIKETGNAAGVAVTVTAVKLTNQVGLAGMGQKAEPGETFVVIDYTLKNTGDKPLTLMERPTLGLVDGKGQTYSPDELSSGTAAIMMDDASGMSSDLNPNVSAKTKAAWKVDKASFDAATWILAVATDPVLKFSLK